MTNTLGWLYFLGFSMLSGLLWRAALKWGDQAARIPLGLYGLFYVSTTVIGATIIALTNGDALADLGWGLDMSPLRDFASLTYWGLLFAPLIILPGMLLFLGRSASIEQLMPSAQRLLSKRVSPVALCAVFSVFSLYCFGQLLITGQLGYIFSHTGETDYVSMILMRSQLLQTVGSIFFGLVYVTLPGLSFAALYQWAKQRTLQRALIFLGMVLTLGVLYLSLMQKSPMLIYLVFVGFALVELKVVRPKAIVIVFGAVVGILTIMQSLVLEQWTIGKSFSLLLFRMAHGFPYYVNVFPDVLPYAGVDFGQHRLGIGERILEHEELFNIMYPDCLWVQGAAPGPAHVRAYAQGGIVFAMATLFALGMCVRLIGVLRKRMTGPIGFALYVQSLMFLYFSTQTSLREALASCYGLVWAFIGIVPLILVGRDESRRRRQPVDSPSHGQERQNGSRRRVSYQNGLARL